MKKLGRWARGQRRAFACTIRLLQILRHGGSAAGLYVLASAISALSRVTQAIAVGVLMSGVLQAAGSGGFTGPLVGALGAFAAVFLVRSAATGVRDAVEPVAASHIENWVRRRVRASLKGTPGIEHIEDPKTQNDIAISTGYTGGPTLADAAIATVTAAAEVLTILASGLVVVRLHLGLAILYVALLLCGRALLRQKTIDLVVARSSQADLFRRSAYLTSLGRVAAKEARVCGLADLLLGWHDDAHRRSLGAVLAASWERQRVQVVVVGVGAALLGLIGFVAAQRVLAGELAVGAATTYLLAAEAMLASLIATSSPSGQAVELLHAFDRLQDAGTAVGAFGDEPKASAPTSRNAPLVELRGVSFGYPGSDAIVLDDVDLTIHEGESLAVVGVNGAGKTSLIKLISGLYVPTSGEVLVRGRSLTVDRVPEWRSELGVVFQDFVQYPLTLSANVSLGAGRTRGDDALVSNAIIDSGGRDLLEQLPAGLSTVLSREFTGGAQLSGGQWQRIALARAIYASQCGASLILLDEPTANLDVRAELEAFDRLRAHAGRIATVIVSHRFSTVRRADRIVVIDGGRVVQDGAHATLMATPGIYREMFNRQAAHFDRVAPASGGESSEGAR